MRELFTVISFTMKDMVKRKSFIISTLIILLLIVVGFNVPNIMKAISGDNFDDSKILVVDSDNIYEGTLVALNDMDLGYEFDIKNELIDDTEIKDLIENGDYDSSIVIEKNDGNVKVRYIVENMVMMEGVPTECISSLNAIYTNLQISKLGLTQEQLLSLSPNFEYVLEQTEEEKVEGNVFAIMLLSIVLFYAIYFCAYQVSSSITTEKTSKIMETLVTSTSPRKIVLGKTIGIGLVGLVQVCLLVLTAVICANVFLEPGMLDSILDMSQITPFLAIVIIIYFILGYFAFALMYALTGSTVSKPEDIQSANSPVALLSVIGFYLAYFTMMNPTSELNMFAAMFPLSSPFCMPFRVMMGIADLKDVVISVAILMITIIVIAKVAIKIYSSAILNYGSKMSFKDILKLYKDKNN